jgi:hypothetical protein
VAGLDCIKQISGITKITGSTSSVLTGRFEICAIEFHSIFDEAYVAFAVSNLTVQQQHTKTNPLM